VKLVEVRGLLVELRGFPVCVRGAPMKSCPLFGGREATGRERVQATPFVVS